VGLVFPENLTPDDLTITQKVAVVAHQLGCFEGTNISAKDLPKCKHDKLANKRAIPDDQTEACKKQKQSTGDTVNGTKSVIPK
jgi:hypothetical protein